MILRIFLGKAELRPKIPEIQKEAVKETEVGKEVGLRKEAEKEFVKVAREGSRTLILDLPHWILLRLSSGDRWGPS